MKHLSKVILKNFQSHEYSIIEFKEGLNVIVGPSDTGKSAIIRGIKWVLYNEPSGNYFIREGETECSVVLEFNDGTRVKRFRSRSKNMYILYGRRGKKTKYEGFGTSVPEEIVEAIRVKKIYLDGEESNSINLGEQLEGPFLLSEKTSTRASAIGRLIGVNIIDEALRETLKDLRTFNNRKRDLDEKTELLTGELKDYEYLDGLSNNIDKISKIKNLIREKSTKLEKLKELSSDFLEAKRGLKKVNIYLEKLSNLDILEENLKNISYLNNHYTVLKNRNKNLMNYRREINKNIDIMEMLDKIENVEENLNLLLKYYNEKSSLEKIHKELSLNIKETNNIKKINDQLKNVSKLESIINIINTNISTLGSFKYVGDKFKINKKRLEAGAIYIDNLQNLDFIREIYKKVEKKLKTLNIYNDIRIRMEVYQKSLNEEQNKRKDSEDNIKKELDKYKKLLEEIEICPVCLSNINNDKIQYIVEHYN